MTIYKLFYEFLSDLADLFDQEQRGGGHAAALELRKLSGKSHTAMPPAHQLLPDMVQTALTINPHPLAEKLQQILPVVDWHYSGLADDRIREDIAKQMVTCELIGPDGMLFCENLRVGLFAQSANLDYPIRTHPAEETFIVLGGSAEFQSGEEAPRKRVAGDQIHHKSKIPHASVTKDEPMIAAWRWTGNIAYEGYELIG